VPAFSVHADQAELLGWLRAAPRRPEMVYIVHGEAAASAALQRAVESELQWTAVTPRYLEAVRLD
jgi:metallo-beta-lactamase family protein